MNDKKAGKVYILIDIALMAAILQLLQHGLIILQAPAHLHLFRY